MGEKSAKDKEKEGEKITAILTRWEYKRLGLLVGYQNNSKTFIYVTWNLEK